MSIQDDQKLKEALIDKLIATQSIKYGHFVLKSGSTSPYYVNLRETTMDSNLFKDIVSTIKIMIEREILSSLQTKSSPMAIVGVPYGVVPIAAAVAYATDLPYYPIRKETKEYGCKPDHSSYTDYNFIMIEDVMSTGSSIMETIDKMSNANVTDVIVVVNRESGGSERLKKEYPELRLHSILNISDFSSISEKCSYQPR